MDIITRAVSPVSISNVSKTENRLGSECSGSDGGTSRTLTLNNTSLTYNVIAYLDGLALHSSRVTVTNNATGSTVQFNDAIYNDQPIVVTYIA